MSATDEEKDMEKQRLVTCDEEISRREDVGTQGREGDATRKEGRCKRPGAYRIAKSRPIVRTLCSHSRSGEEEA